MRWQSARWRQRWSRAWKSGGAGVKAVAVIFAVLTVPPSLLWLGRGLLAPWVYYSLGLSMEATAVLVGVCAALPFTFVMARAGLDSSTATIVIIFIFSSFTAYSGAMGAMTFLNGALDSSAPQSHMADVLARSPWTKVTLRYLRVTSWRPGESDVKVWVTFDLYRSDPRRVAVTTRSGALGFEWVESATSAAETKAP
jgi:hypothetical protein